MKLTKQEQELEILSLNGFGLLPEEIEGYFDFYNEELTLDKPKKRKILMINSRKKAEKV